MTPRWTLLLGTVAAGIAAATAAASWWPIALVAALLSAAAVFSLLDLLLERSQRK